jgi:uncharacterized protein (TIRG00374 family)
MLERLRRIARSKRLPLAASLVLVVGGAWWIGRQEPPRVPSGAAALVEVLLAACAYAAATVGRAERWRILLAACGVRAATGDVYKLTPVGYMGNNILPARAGEILRTMLLAPRARASKTNVLGTIVAERAFDAVTLSALFFACLVVIGTTIGTTGVICVAVMTVAIGAALVALLHAGRFAHNAESSGARRLRLPLRLLGEVAEPLRRIRGGVALRVLTVSLLVWTAEAFVYLLCGDAVGVHISFFQSVSVMVIGNIAALIPAAPGYLGTYDAAVLGTLGALGVTASAASGCLLLLRFVLFVPITIVGLGLFIGSYAGLERLRTSRLRAEKA